MSSASAAVALLAGGGLVAALTQLPLAWDGAYIAMNVLWTQAPFAPHERWANIPLQVPTLLLSRWITGSDVLTIVFSASYALIPAVALAVSWWVVRRQRPHLILWPALGIGLVALPGQAFFVSEAIFSTQLMWPLVLAAAVGDLRRHGLLLGGLALFLAVAHPITIPLLGLVLVFGLLPRRGRPTRPAAIASVLGAVVLLLFGLRFLGGANGYQTDQISLGVLADQAEAVLTPRPLIALILTTLGAWLLLLRKAALGVLGTVMDGVAVGSLLGAGAVLLHWAADPFAWTSALEYRGLVLFTMLPLYGGALIDARWRADNLSERRLPRVRRAALVLASGVWAGVTVLQGLSWHATLNDFRMYLELSPRACVPSDTIGGIERSPLHHWSVTPLSLLVGGREPPRLVLQGDGCQQRLANGFPITGVEVRGWEARWFEMAPLQRLIAVEQGEPRP